MMSIYDKTDHWDEENAGRPLPPTRQQLEARIAELVAERNLVPGLRPMSEAVLAEREACVQIVDERWSYAPETIAAAIRARPAP